MQIFFPNIFGFLCFVIFQKYAVLSELSNDKADKINPRRPSRQ